MPRQLRDELFLAPLPEPHPTGWTFEVSGQAPRRYGPYPTQHLALSARFELFGRWRAAAKARGGWAWKQTEERWVVTVPPLRPPAGLPFRVAPCSRHA